MIASPIGGPYVGAQASSFKSSSLTMSIELKLSRASRIYHPSEPLEGKIIVKSSSSISHYGVRLTVNGSVNLQIRGGSAGIIESLYGVVKPISILSSLIGLFYTLSLEMCNVVSLGIGTQIPFSMFLRQPGKDNLERFYETFHGANISAQYLVTVDIIRGYLHKALSATVEFIVESDKGMIQS
ncbi:down syndrome critical region protein 3 [Quercus suber]|uniref:Down syndrome critical region protein 3 n=1 Tax=Quercus suber TaxID=58331 RepID=A0AAW0JGZ5_QUESU